MGTGEGSEVKSTKWGHAAARGSAVVDRGAEERSVQTYPL